MRDRPVAWVLIVAIGIELILIPVFLVTGADATLDRALDRAGFTFNTDLVHALRLVVVVPASLGAVLLALAQVASPDVALVVVVGLGSGLAGLRPVARRLRWWHPSVGVRTGFAVWALMAVTFCAMNLGSALLHAATIGGRSFSWDRPASITALVGGLAIAMFLDGGALFEESAWRGFMLPSLQERHAPARAAVLVGLAWAAWHVPVKFGILLDYGSVQGTLLFGVLTLKFVALSVIMAAFVNRVGYSTLLAIAMHGLSNDSLRLGGFVDSRTFREDLLSEINLLIPMVIVGAIIVTVTRGRLWFEHVAERNATVGIP